jgi:hypothetical protein
MTAEGVAHFVFIKREFTISRRDAPEVCWCFPPRRAWGTPDARCTPQPRVRFALVKKHTSNEYTSITRHSHAMVLTVSFVLL